MTDDLNNLDFDDDVIEGSEGEEGNPYQEPAFDPDTYVKPYIGADGQPEPDIIEGGENSGGENSDDEDLITTILKSKGITNPASIKYETEDGSIEEKDFDSLSKEEQLAILTASDEVGDEPDLEEEEINFLNELRENNLSINDYLSWVKEQAIEEFVSSQETGVNYEIDTLSDEELFILDLKDTTPDLSDEECLAMLDHERSNEALWAKRMQGLRNSYRMKEETKRAEEELIQQQENQRELEEFQNRIVEAVDKVDFIGEFDLEDEDKEQIAQFILGTDKTGTRYFARALNDPETLTKMAWFALNGEDALDTLSKYYKDQIDAYSKANYKKGFEDGQKGKSTQKPAPKSTVRKPAKSTDSEPKYKPLSDPIYIDLD